jgi:Mor family transcriptional regulator
MTPKNQPTAVIRAEDLAELHCLLDPDYPDYLRTIAEWLFVQAVEDEVPAPTKERKGQLALLALRQTERLSVEEGGKNFYFPKAISYRATVRDREMYGHFLAGKGYDELAKFYHLSPMRIRQIVGSMLLLERSTRQGTLNLE